MMRVLLAALSLLAAAIGLPTVAAAQSPCPYIAFGVVLTAAQWQQCFEAKSDVPPSSGFLPLGGGTMTGRLVTAVPTAAQAMFNLPFGTTPTSPVNGDTWATTAGLFFRLNGSTYNITAGLLPVINSGYILGNYTAASAAAQGVPWMAQGSGAPATGILSALQVYCNTATTASTVCSQWNPGNGGTAQLSPLWNLDQATNVLNVYGIGAGLTNVNDSGLGSTNRCAGNIGFPLTNQYQVGCSQFPVVSAAGDASINTTVAASSVLLSVNTAHSFVWNAPQTFAPSTTAGAGLFIPLGKAPSSPRDGAFWQTKAGLYGANGGSTYNYLMAALLPSGDNSGGVSSNGIVITGGSTDTPTAANGIVISGSGTPTAANGVVIVATGYTPQTWPCALAGQVIVSAVANSTVPTNVQCPGGILIASNGDIGFGTDTNPQAPWVFSQNATTGISTVTSGLVVIGADGTGAGVSNLNFAINSGFSAYRADGTAASPSALGSGEFIGASAFAGYNGTTYVGGARILAITSEAWGGSANGEYFRFDTTLAGGTTRRSSLCILGGVVVGTGCGSSYDPGLNNLAVVGHYRSNGTAPGVSSCGTSPAITGTDVAGIITAGSGTVTSCTVTFASAYASAPACHASSSTAITSLTVSSSTAALVIGGASLTSDTIYYTCMGTSFLLRRDLDPASNDNEPIFLNEAA